MSIIVNELIRLIKSIYGSYYLHKKLFPKFKTTNKIHSSFADVFLIPYNLTKSN